MFLSRFSRNLFSHQFHYRWVQVMLLLCGLSVVLIRAAVLVCRWFPAGNRGLSGESSSERTANDWLYFYVLCWLYNRFQVNVLRGFFFKLIGINPHFPGDFDIFPVFIQGLTSCLRAFSIFGKSSFTLTRTFVLTGLSPSDETPVFA